MKSPTTIVDESAFVLGRTNELCMPASGPFVRWWHLQNGSVGIDSVIILLLGICERWLTS